MGSRQHSYHHVSTMRVLIAAALLLIPLAAGITSLVVPRVSVEAAAEPAAPYQSGILYSVEQTPTDTHTPTSTPTNTSTPSRTPTPSRTSPATEVTYVDIYEPNNSLGQSATYTVGNGTCSTSSYNITLWPVGDIDYFKFIVKAGHAYEIKTTIQVGDNLDTFLRVFNTNGVLVASDDDGNGLGLGSFVTVTADANGYYFAEVSNLSGGDPAGQEYCLTVEEVPVVPTNTPIPVSAGGTPDACEYNGSFEDACLLGVNAAAPVTFPNLNFVPTFPPGPDNDYYYFWVRTGLSYRCATINLSAVADTNMIVYDQNGAGIGGNADRDLANGDLGSEVSWTATYDGYAYVLVGPQNPPDYEDSGQHVYDLECEMMTATVTPTPRPTNTPRPVTGGGSGGGATAIPPTFPPFPTFPPTATQIDPSSFVATATPRPVVQILPLPTPAPVASGNQQELALNLTLYYDNNGNFEPELTEGIVDIAIALYDTTTGQLLAFGYTNDAGFVRFPSIMASGSVRVVVPFLNYTQTVAAGQQEIVLRVAPRPLPSTIP